MSNDSRNKVVYTTCPLENLLTWGKRYGRNLFFVDFSYPSQRFGIKLAWLNSVSKVKQTYKNVANLISFYAVNFYAGKYI